MPKDMTIDITFNQNEELTKYFFLADDLNALSNDDIANITQNCWNTFEQNRVFKVWIEKLFKDGSRWLAR